MITTLGLPGERGVVALDSCAADDADCFNGSSDHPYANWHFYQPPYIGGATVLEGVGTNSLLIDNGGHQITFTISTATFSAAAT